MPRSLNHRKITKLPDNALKVKEYADRRPCSTSLIYKEIERKIAKFEIVEFQGINFVVPFA